MEALDKSFVDAIAAHALLCFEIGASDYGEGIGVRFNAMAQWADEAANLGRGIATGTGDTINEAVFAMLKSMSAKRGGGLIDTSQAIEVAA